MATLLALLLVAAAAATAIALTRRALRHWRAERAGRPYELPENRLGTALRAVAATTAALVTATLAVTLLGGTNPSHHHATASPGRTPTGRAAERRPEPVPPPPARTPQPAPPPPESRTVGHPAGGTLQVLRDGTQVWLPPRYDSARAAGIAYPVVLARIPVPGDDDLYAGLALGVDRRLADPFIVVTPPGCGRDATPVLSEVDRRYRTLTAPTARAALGIGPGALCAVREALAHPGRYAAAVGVSGTYPRLAPGTGPRIDAGSGSGSGTGPYPPVLLAASAGESACHASARALRTALRPRGLHVRLLDGIPRRRELFVRIAGYLTEKLDGPARVEPVAAGPADTAAAPGPSVADGSSVRPGPSAANGPSATSGRSVPPEPLPAPARGSAHRPAPAPAQGPLAGPVGNRHQTPEVP